jgi:uncharacterized protein YciI
MPRHFLLMYTLSADYLERRGEFRAVHLGLAQAAAARGELLMAGALSEPADTALLLFIGEGSEAAEAFAHADPYVQNGLVLSWQVRPWTTVAGPLAAQPVAL